MHGKKCTPIGSDTAQELTEPAGKQGQLSTKTGYSQNTPYLTCEPAQGLINKAGPKQLSVFL
jgi:hypothetical protein